MDSLIIRKIAESVFEFETPETEAMINPNVKMSSKGSFVTVDFGNDAPVSAASIKVDNITIFDTTAEDVEETFEDCRALFTRLSALGLGKSSAGDSALTSDELAAVQNANNPSAGNPFATVEDLGDAPSGYTDAMARAAAVQNTMAGGTGKAPDSDAVNAAISNASAVIKDIAIDQTTTSDTAVNITGLVLPLEANSKYVLRGNIRNGSSNNNGVKIGIVVPTATTFFVVGTSREVANNTILFNTHSVSGILGAAFNKSPSQTGMYLLNGTITTGATAGNLQIQFASGVSGQTATILVDGTYLELIKIR